MTQNRAYFSEAGQRGSPENQQDCWLRARGWGLLAVLVSTVYPRVLSLGDFPCMDEGFYAYWAQFVHQSLAQGQGLPDTGGFMLYPLLLSWLCALPGNMIIWLRLADMLMAAWAGWLFCRLLVRESRSVEGGVLLALFFLSAMNAPVVIDAGFKNSIFAAYVPLFLAVELVREQDARSPRWFFAGVLTALGVLLREPFAVFAVAGAAAVWAGRGPQALWRYVAGGCLGGMLVLALVGFLRGGVAELIQAYVQAGAVYGAEAGRTWYNFTRYGMEFLLMFGPLLLLTAVAVVVLLYQMSWATYGRALFWLILALLPLLEPLSKLGFVYHFAVVLPGCAGLCALAWSKIPPLFPLLERLGKLGCVVVHRLAVALPGCAGRGARAWSKIAPVCSRLRGERGVKALFLAMFAFLVLTESGQARMTLDTLRAFPSSGWPEKYVPKSNTLLAGNAIRAVLPPGGSLCISGFMFFLYPVTGALPPSPAMGDLSRTFIFSGYDPARFENTLRKDPPDVLVIAKAQGEHSAVFTKELQDVVEKSGLYVRAAEIPVDGEKNYGWIGCTVYRRALPLPAGQTQPHIGEIAG